MRAGVAQGGLVSSEQFSLYVNDIPTPSRHVELAQYADDTALIATSRNPSFLAGYLAAYLGRLELWLWDCRVAINVSKSTVVPFAKARGASDSPGQCSFSESQQSRSITARCLGVTLDTRLTYLARQPGEKEGSSKTRRVWPPP
jgi:hypothetical protein